MKHILVNNIIIFLFIFLNSFTNSITSIKKNKTFKTIVNPKPKNTSIHNPTKMKTIKKTFKTRKIFQETSNDIVFNKKFIGASIVKITNGKMVASSNIILTNITKVIKNVDDFKTVMELQSISNIINRLENKIKNYEQKLDNINNKKENEYLMFKNYFEINNDNEDINMIDDDCIMIIDR